MEMNEEEIEESKLKKVERMLKEAGLSESDLKKLEQRDYVNIGEEAKEILKNSGITEEMIEEALIKSNEEPEDVAFEETRMNKKLEEQERFLGDETKEEVTMSEIKMNPREEIERFLRERSLSESLIKTLLKVGFTDEFLRLLRAMGFVDEDIAELQKLWDLEAKEREETGSTISEASSSDEYLSPDGLYLKHFLSKHLTRALREIIAKKPFDPVEYLGHWLLNYKICEERDARRREFELKLLIERERLKSRAVEDDSISVSMKHEEEEEFTDWNYLDYE